jgi:hypothetical protein
MFSLLILTAALAQAPPAERPAQRGRVVGLTNGELVNMLDTYAIVQAQDALQIGDNQYGQFVNRLKRLQEVRRRNSQARTRIIRELQKLTAPGVAPDETAIRERLKSLKDHDDKAAGELARAHEGVDELLDPRQQARFRIFEEQMERKKLDLLMRARNRAAPAPAQPRKPDGS